MGREMKGGPKGMDIFIPMADSCLDRGFDRKQQNSLKQLSFN